MKVIGFITFSFLVYLNGRHAQGFQPPPRIPYAKPLGFITYPRLLRPIPKYDPASQNIDQTFELEPYNTQNVGVFSNKDTAISNFKEFHEDLSKSSGIYVIRILYQKLKHPRIFEHTSLRDFPMPHVRFWYYVTDVFVQMYAYKYPEDIAVFRGYNLRKHYEKLKSIVPVFMTYIMNRWGYDITFKTSLRTVYNDLKKHKDLDFNTFLNYVVKQEKSFNPTLSFPTINQGSSNYNNINFEDATSGASASSDAVNQLEEIKEEEEDNNLSISSEKDEIIPSNSPSARNCDVGAISGSLITLLHNSDITQEKDNLEKLFNTIKTYSSSLGTNPSFGDVVQHVERELLNSKQEQPEKTIRDARNQGFSYGWNVFLHEYNKGQLSQILQEIQAGREKDEGVVVKKLTDVFLNLKQILRASRLPEPVINLVLKQALMMSLGDISSFIYEQCTRTSISRFSQILETALNLNPQEPISPPIGPILEPNEPK